jgi:hypothetical protein
MTVRLLTGAPGAGKTTFGVSQVLAPLMGSKLVIEDGARQGESVDRRCVVAGVRGLILDHEKLPHRLTGDAVPAYAVEFWNQVQATPSAAGTIYAEFVKNAKLQFLEDEPLYQRLPDTPALRRVPKAGTVALSSAAPLELGPDGEVTEGVASEWIEVPRLVQNWWLWCQPGDTIFVDEVQFLAPRASLGRRVPLWLQLLEIHRHYGVDFVFVTQHPQLVDTTIRALVGHHQHVRSIMGSSLCSVYTWDHASNPERFNLANKRLWKRGRKDYKLFHSAAAHITPPAGGRSILVVLPLLVVGLVGGAYAFTSRWRDPPTTAKAVPGQPGHAGSSLFSLPGQAVAAPAGQVVHVGGCYTVPSGACKCITREGRPFAAGPQLCAVSSVSFDGLVKWNARMPPAATTPAYGAAAGSGGGVGSPPPSNAPTAGPAPLS